MIQLYSYKRRSSRVTHPDVWSYKRINFLTDWCWKYLLKKGALTNFIEDKEKISVIKIDEDKLYKQITLALRGLYSVDYKIKKIYMGPEVLEQCLYEKTDLGTHPLNFDVTLNKDRKIFGIPVEVIPHMKGILIV
jgi:hypothetical protein